MQPRKIDTDNFADVIKEMRLFWLRQMEELADDAEPSSPRQVKVVDLSNTDFRDFLPSHISELFTHLSFLPQTFILKLNFCRFDEQNVAHFDALTLGIMTTKNIQGLEFNRSISPACEPELSEKFLLGITQSIIRSPHINYIILDGFRVTPPSVYELLKQHLQNSPIVLVIFIDGLKLRHNSLLQQGSLFKPKSAANEPNLPDVNPIATPRRPSASS